MGRRSDSERVSALDFQADFEVSDLARHTDRRFPYWTATVWPKDNSGPRKIHNRSGAWHIQIGESEYEPEAVFGGEMGRRVKFLVANKVLPLERKISEAIGDIPASKVEA